MPKGQKRDRDLHIRLMPREYELLEARAAREGVSISELVRSQMLIKLR